MDINLLYIFEFLMLLIAIVGYCLSLVLTGKKANRLERIFALLPAITALMFIWQINYDYYSVYISDVLISIAWLPIYILVAIYFKDKNGEK